MKQEDRGSGTRGEGLPFILPEYLAEVDEETDLLRRACETFGVILHADRHVTPVPVPFKHHALPCGGISCKIGVVRRAIE